MICNISLKSLGGPVSWANALNKCSEEFSTGNGKGLSDETLARMLGKEENKPTAKKQGMLSLQIKRMKSNKVCFKEFSTLMTFERNHRKSCI